MGVGGGRARQLKTRQDNERQNHEDQMRKRKPVQENERPDKTTKDKKRSIRNKKRPDNYALRPVHPLPIHRCVLMKYRTNQK
jgi:hypothetical protein